MLFLSPTLFSIIEVLVVLLPALIGVAFVTVAERKTMASMQRRLGPNIVGFYGLLQAFADALKLILKEYVSPTQANLFLFFLGPIITLVFSLLGYAVIPYGPGLAISDFNLGILYILAVSSLATYGILLAGLIISPPIMWIVGDKLGKFRERLILSQLEAKHEFNLLVYLRVIFFLLKKGKSQWCIRVYFIIMSSCLKHERSTTSRWVYKDNNSTTNTRSLALYLILLSNLLFLNKTLQIFMAWLWFLLFFYIGGVSPDCEYIYSSSVCMSSQIRTKLFKDIRQCYYTTLISNNDNTEDLQDLHAGYIRELYKDREAPVIPFDRDLILATCYDCLDKNKKSEFLKEWGSIGCIYAIEYKYNPFIYYIGRTTLFKRRWSNHLLADSNSKLHVFWS